MSQFDVRKLDMAAQRADLAQPMPKKGLFSRVKSGIKAAVTAVSTAALTLYVEVQSSIAQTLDPTTGIDLDLVAYDTTAIGNIGGKVCGVIIAMSIAFMIFRLVRQR